MATLKTIARRGRGLLRALSPSSDSPLGRALRSFDGRVHQFDNGVKVYRRQLIGLQLDRYKTTNLHEPEEERHFVEAFARLKPGDVFLDVGAAVGYYSLLAARNGKALDIRAFEPQPRMRRDLEQNIVLNAARGIVIEPVAVADEEGWCRIDGGFGAAIGPGRGVRQTTLDLFIAGLGKPVGLVKLDIQGAELRAIRGARGSFARIANWIVGTHSPELHRDCLAALREGGYQILHEDPQPRGQPDGIISASRDESPREP